MTLSIDGLRDVIEGYHDRLRWDATKQQHRDPFIDWFQRLDIIEPSARVLIVLINARFDQGTLAERALENTRMVLDAGILDQESVTLDAIPLLKTRQRVRPERWRELFWRSLPILRRLAREIVARRFWRAQELIDVIRAARVPWFGPKTTRLAVRWLSELVPDVQIDMRDSEVPVDSLVYRVAARLGVVDPIAERYTGPGSPGHASIQRVARDLFPENPSLMDEPLWMMGRKSGNGGFCYPTSPACDQGCIFKTICSRLWLDQDPAALGYSAQGGVMMQQPKLVHITKDSTVIAKPVPGLLVIVSCVKNKAWDANPTAPISVAAGEAYCGSYFNKNSRYAKAFGDAWCILSAKFGFVLPHEEIQNYNATFKNHNPDLVDLDRLINQIEAKGLVRFRQVQVLGGKEYVERAKLAFERYGIPVEAPLQGHKIGQSMHVVQCALNAGHPLGNPAAVKRSTG